MTSPAAAVAVAAVRWWTRFYTWGLAVDVAARRRAEIESDLWELQHDPEGRHGLAPAAHMWVRLFGGLAHDLSWRIEQSAMADTLRRAAIVTTTTVFLLTALWVVPLWSGNKPRQRCVAYQQIAAQLHPSASCECVQRAPETGSRSRPRNGAHVTRLICRP